MTMILSPAYGRDYKTAAQVRAAWEAGKDFRIETIGPYCGKYCSIRDVESYPDAFVGAYIRYNRLTELTFIGSWEEPEEMEGMVSTYEQTGAGFQEMPPVEENPDQKPVMNKETSYEE